MNEYCEYWFKVTLFIPVSCYPKGGEIQLTARNSTPWGGEYGVKCVTLWLL